MSNDEPREEKKDIDWLRSFKIQQKEAERRAKQDQRALDSVIQMETEALERKNRIEFKKQATQRMSVETLIVDKYKKEHWAEIEKKRAMNIAKIEANRTDTITKKETNRRASWAEIDLKISNAKKQAWQEYAKHFYLIVTHQILKHFYVFSKIVFSKCLLNRFVRYWVQNSHRKEAKERAEEKKRRAELDKKRNKNIATKARDRYAF